MRNLEAKSIELELQERLDNFDFYGVITDYDQNRKEWQGLIEYASKLGHYGIDMVEYKLNEMTGVNHD